MKTQEELFYEWKPECDKLSMICGSVLPQEISM